MASTKYQVFSGGKALEGTKSKKSVAVDEARKLRNAERVDVRVETTTGTVVFEQAAPKTIKMTPQYQRVVELPEGLEIPAGARACYFRPRRNGVILHDASAEKGSQYSIMDATTGRVLRDRFPTTRAAGARLNLGIGRGKVEQDA